MDRDGLVVGQVRRGSQGAEAERCPRSGELHVLPVGSRNDETAGQPEGGNHGRTNWQR